MIGSEAAFGINLPRIELDSAKVIMSAMSPLSSPPSTSKNFIPFRFEGMWLAVTMMAPSHLNSSKTVDMNIAGVDESPESKTLAPYGVSAETISRTSSGPEILESRPTAMQSSFGSLSVLCDRRYRKPLARRETASESRFTGSAGLPIAMPRISLPFCNFE